MHITLDTKAVIVVVPDKIVGVKVVDVDVALEKLPPVEDQEIEVPYPVLQVFLLHLQSIHQPIMNLVVI